MLDVMRKCDVCRLAIHDGDYPYIVPLNFGLSVTGDKMKRLIGGERQKDALTAELKRVMISS